ncbi:SDR family oxidoreductase [Halobacteriovorax sp. RT-2-4]|uniref:SDR family oxidoreductase n=1 Tax=unclassified Halobacteriovorax TaxID=2639665 RepID=UPI00399A4F2D
MIALTGASGQLGQLVIKALLDEGVKANEIVAIARSTDKLSDYEKQGVQVRFGDYEKPDTLDKALAGVDKLLLISASEVGKRLPQHKNVIEAVKRSSVKHLTYTSILHADKSPLGLAKEHVETEQLINELNIATTILRNGWYSENYTMGLPNIIEHSTVIGCAGDGKLSTAAREDYALAAAKVLTSEGHTGKVYELAGDEAFTLSEFAEVVGKEFEREIKYQNLSEVEFKSALMQAGLPEGFAQLLADSEKGASNGGLFDNQRQLSKLIGRPTTTISKSIRDFKESYQS